MEKVLRQLVVFTAKGFIQNLFGSRAEGFIAAKIANTDCYRHTKVDIAFVAQLPKVQLPEGAGASSPFAQIANSEFAFGCHWPSPDLGNLKG